MSLNLNEFIVEVHKNADEHGWWDEEKSIGKILVLIHSEISEALEEYRADKPLVWYECPMADRQMCDWPNTDCKYKGNERCMNLHREPKPEGIAVELIDAVIRIFDFIGAIGAHLSDCETVDDVISRLGDGALNTCSDDIPELFCQFHRMVSEAYMEDEQINVAADLMTVVGMIFEWVRRQGLDPEQIMLVKHEYNKTRPWRHNGKRC